MRIAILGGGLAGLSLAHFLNRRNKETVIDIFEKESEIGGLCRSFESGGLFWDIGPHIIFSKDQAVLDFMINLLDGNQEKIKRSNQILYKDNFVKYPFENYLSALPKEDKEYCLNTFLNNPYKNYCANNMLAFFLKTFGEGITNSYLLPYNEKIWKFSPAFINTNMVDRIPNPPVKDIIQGAEGNYVEGYTHQLYFYYPKTGGIASVIKALENSFKSFYTKIYTNSCVSKLDRSEKEWYVIANDKKIGPYDKIISTIPLREVPQLLNYEMPREIRDSFYGLKENSIAIILLRVNSDKIGDNWSITIPDKNILPHRISRLNFLGKEYARLTNILVEVTYRKNDLISLMTSEEICNRVINDLCKIGFIEGYSDIKYSEVRRFDYAYVVYDLNYNKNIRICLDYLNNRGIIPHGRFGTYSYLNMDAIIRNSIDLVTKII